MNYMAGFLIGWLALDVLGIAGMLKANRYPRVTLLPVLDDKGEHTNQVEARRQFAVHDKFRIVFRLALMSWLIYLLTN